MKSTCPCAQRATSVHGDRYSLLWPSGPGDMTLLFQSSLLLLRRLYRGPLLFMLIVQTLCSAKPTINKWGEQLSRNLTDFRVFSLTLNGERREGGGAA